MMLYLVRYPQKGINETIYLYKKRMHQLYLPHDFVLDVVEIIRRGLLTRREILSCLIFGLLSPLIYFLFILVIPLIYIFFVFWLSEYIYFRLWGDVYKYTDFEMNKPLKILYMLEYSVVYNINKAKFFNRGLFLRFIFSRVVGVSYFFLGLCSKIYWGIWYCVGEVEWGSKFKISWPLIFFWYQNVYWEKKLTTIELELRHFCINHTIFKEGNRQRFNPHFITENVKNFNIGRGVECAKIIVTSSNIMENVSEDDYTNLFDDGHNKLCCAYVGYKQHLANIILSDTRAKIVNAYTSGHSLRIGGNSWKNDPILNQFYEEDVYTSAKQEKYTRLAYLRNNLITPYKNVDNIGAYYAGKTTASLNFMSSHDKFRSVLALKKDEAYLMSHNENGVATEIVPKKNFNFRTQSFVNDSYKSYEKKFKTLAESHLDVYLKSTDTKISYGTRVVIIRELTTDYMTEVEILPTTVFNDFCGIAVAGSLSTNTSKYAEILTAIKENSIQ